MANEDTHRIEPEAIAVAKLVEKYHQPQIVSLKRGSKDAADVFLAPKGLEVFSIKEQLDEYLTAPERRKGVARLEDLASFIAHAKRFADTDSALFATAGKQNKAPRLVAVLDYHRAGAEGAPRFGEHRAIYEFPLSEPWKTWTGKNGAGNTFTQAAFAEFIEGALTDVAPPEVAGQAALQMAATLGCSFASPARLLDLSRGLALHVKSVVRNIANLSTGEAQFQYATEHADAAGKPLEVPRAFLLAIPVFDGGELYQVPARLRYREREGSVSWYFDLFQADRVFDHAFGEACEKARAETELPLFVGAPES